MATAAAQLLVIDFYPRPPRGGRRAVLVNIEIDTGFRSTPSARRATRNLHVLVQHRKISIHALREEGDLLVDTPGRLRCISIHALREEGDRFNSYSERFGHYISIHALREEGDVPLPPLRQGIRYFYPRPPRGGRPGIDGLADDIFDDFYPRPPRGGRRHVP